jgi:hypothetical protein
MADIALRIAGAARAGAFARIAAKTNRFAGLDVADHVAVTWQSLVHATAAAVLVTPAQIAGDVAAVGGLADVHAGGTEWGAQSAAAIAAIATQYAVHSAAKRRAVRRSRARAEQSAVCLGAISGATIACVRTGVTRLEAIRAAQRTYTLVAAATGTALAVAAAGIAGRLTFQVERGAASVGARAAAAVGIFGTFTGVRGTELSRTFTGGVTVESTTISASAAAVALHTASAND